MRAPLLLWGVVCLGPVLVCGGAQVHLGQHAIPLPLALLYAIPYSPVAHVHHPYRAVAFLVPLLALGAAAAVARWPRWLLPAMAAAMLAETALLSPAIWPLPRTDVRAPPIYAQLSGPGAVLSWPAYKGTWNHAYRAWQVEHGRPMAQGVNVSLTPPVQRDNLVRDLLFAQGRPPTPTGSRAPPGATRLERPVPGQPSALGRMGFGWLVLHEASLPAGEADPVERRLRAWLGEPAVILAWRIPAEEVAAPARLGTGP